jgi:hypothetical protein
MEYTINDTSAFAVGSIRWRPHCGNLRAPPGGSLAPAPFGGAQVFYFFIYTNLKSGA